MASYSSEFRTNYFHVTDEEKWREISRGLTCETGIQDFNPPFSENSRIVWMIENQPHNIYVEVVEDGKTHKRAFNPDTDNIDDFATLYTPEGAILQKRSDDKGVLHGFGGYGSLDWYTPPSLAKPIIDAIAAKVTLYDEDGNTIDYAKINNYNDIYDAVGDDVRPIYSYGEYDDLDNGLDLFLAELQHILPDDEVFICQEIGHEGLRYLVGNALVATNKETKFIDIDTWSRDTAREMLNNPKFETKTSY